MLDPLTALGLAGNVIQIVQFAAQLKTQAQEIRSDGRSRIIREARTIVYDLLKQLERLKKLFEIDGAIHTARLEEDQVNQILCDILCMCTLIGRCSSRSAAFRPYTRMRTPWPRPSFHSGHDTMHTAAFPLADNSADSQGGTP